MTRVEIIAAVRNEEESLPIFVERVRSLPLPDGVELRMVFVEDSSSDDTRQVLRDLAARHPDVGYYFLERGFGQGPAIIYGLSRSRADAAILMDADGSHPPEVIPEMLARHLAGAGVVQCIRRILTRRRAYRRLLTALFRLPARWMTGVDLGQQNIYYRLVSRRFAEVLLHEPRYWRYLRFPLPTEPGVLTLLPIDTEERTHDESKYGAARLAGLAIDAVLGLATVRSLSLGFALAALVAASCVWLGAWPVAVLLAAGVGWTFKRHCDLRSGDLLTRMTAGEFANVPLESAGS